MFKFLFVILFINLCLLNCLRPISDKIFLNYDPSAKTDRVVKEIEGVTLIFGFIPLNKNYVDTKLAINELKLVNQCSDLKNIDIMLYTQNWIVVGFEKMRIVADCVR